MTIYMIFLLLGGLGMFLYGMSMMSQGLENVAGDRMRRVLEVLTNNRFAAVGVGAGITAIIQSSSATTVMVVGFVNAGLMTLIQAAGVIMGANIGTTITAQLLAFKISDIAPIILFIGMLMTIFVKRRMISKIGGIVLGFGILFVGLTLMSQAMEPLQHNESFRNYLVNFNSPILGILIGALFTAVLQSSSASIGILQAMAMLGLIDLNSAVFIVLGQNIGTCVTAVLASIGTSANAKRAAGIHLMFNIIGSIMYLIILSIFPGIITWLETISGSNVSRQIANFHTFFNITITFVLFFFAKQMVNLIIKIIPEKIDPNRVEKRLIYLDERITQTPAIALAQTLKELRRMGDIVSDNLKLSIDAFFSQDEQKAHQVFEIEKTVDYLTHNITNYLIDFRALGLSEHDLKILGTLHHVIIDMERISDHAENIAEFTITLSEKREKLTPEAHEELSKMAEKTIETLTVSLDVFNSRDKSKFDVVAQLEQEVDNCSVQYINNHINRLQEKACNPQIGVIFTNMISTFERIADHANNIAYSLDMK